MFAVQFDRFGPPEVLSVGPYPEPHAGRGEVRVRVRAAGVSPVDVALRAGRSPSRERVALPHIPGVDAAGRRGLAVAAALFEEGRFRIPLQEVFPMAQAARAHAFAARGPRQGKIVLTVPFP
ncbi:zinc-binding dehydrogenase [Sphaerisporangium viridialbum]|uniref:zinc-binding dehydrogenase n=1 Tax=Sphaerisporangium viridialbum TaxID=46189 RepID=UPI003C74EFDF